MPTSTRAGCTSVFMIPCGAIVIASRADRGVRPYKTFFVFADGVCNFVIAFCSSLPLVTKGRQGEV